MPAADDDDPGPRNDAKQDEVANRMVHAASSTGVMQSTQNSADQHQTSNLNSTASGSYSKGATNDPDDLALPPSSISCDATEHPGPRRHRANSRRASFGRPSPLFRPQKHPDDESGNRARASGGSQANAQHHHHSNNGHSGQHHHHNHHHPHFSRLVSQIQAWIDHERAKLEQKDGEAAGHRSDFHISLDKLQQLVHHGLQLGIGSGGGGSGGSAAAAASAATSVGVDHPIGRPSLTGSDIQLPHQSLSKRSSISLRKLGRAPTFSSDTENEVERHPPSVDAVLDNSKTLGQPTLSSTDLTRRATNAEAWHFFKTEVVRLAHTLKLKGWRKVPLEAGDDVEIQRLSGALTNAVYVVNPPSKLPEPTSADNPIPRPPPSKLLLRIYGPQVEHLIDRDSELAILRRLARKNIGPKLLGTFANGRFEEYLNAKTLTANEIREPTTSKQIAKRMRELHAGVSLLSEEREAGPFVWQNWDKWKERCEEVIEWLDDEIKAQGEAQVVSSRKRIDSWRARGHVCGVEWKVFRTAVRAYRSWLEEQYGGHEKVLESLVFAHNDTQYGNLLRLMPDDRESPLLQPANQYRRLVVIDFEYANANTPGMEFANHFTEWCYNYHSDKPYSCVTDAYPSIEEQQRFIQAYVGHVPHFASHTPGGATPVLGASPSPFAGATQSPRMGPRVRSSVSDFMLDSRASPAAGGGTGSGSGSGSQGRPASSISPQSAFGGGSRSYEEEEKGRDDTLEKEVRRLMRETRLWRMANSAQWVAWGIVQAKVPGMEEALRARRRAKADEHAKQAPGHRHDYNETEGAVSPLDVGTSSVQDDMMRHQLVHDTVTEPRVKDEGKDATTTRAEAAEEEEEEEEEEQDADEFDYLAYAQERALFFWGDVLALGLVKEAELPADLVARAKRVDR